MKNLFRSMLVLTLTLCLLVSVSSVFAERYDFQDGVLPEGWTHITNGSEVTAVNILNPVNPNASQEARNLYAYMCTLIDTDTFMTGQFDIAGTNQVYEQIVEEFGIEPALYSNRYTVDVTHPYVDGEDENGNPKVVVPEETMDFTNVDSANALMLQHYENGNVLLIHSDSAPRTLCSEMLIKKGLSMNVSSSDYDAPDGIMHLDVTNPDRDMQTYELWIKYQSNVIAALKEMEALGVKAYLWRPWIEFNMLRFNGSSTEGYAAFVRVYQQTVQMMIDSGLEGFLVTFSPNNWSRAQDRNPGNDYIDAYGATMYSDGEFLGRLHSPYPNYEWYSRSGKPIGFTEYSCRTGSWREVGHQGRGSSFDLMRDTIAMYPNTVFVNYWGDGPYSPINNNGNMKSGNDDGRLYLDSPYTLDLREIVDYRNTKIEAPGICQMVLSTDAAGSYHGLEQRSYTAADLKTMNLNIQKLSAVRVNTGYAITFYESEDCSGEGYGYVGSNKGIAAATAATFKSLAVTEIPNVSQEKAYIYGSDNDDEAYKANDGLPSYWTAQTSADGTAWLMIDLEQPYSINKYTLQNAGVAGAPSIDNTKDFQVQYSNDNKTWTTVSAVTNNTDSVVTKMISPVVARYWRLLITGANSSSNAAEQNKVTISEFQLFGVLAPEEAAAPPTVSDVVSTPENSGNGNSDDNYYEEPGSSYEPGDDTSDPAVDEPETSEPSDNKSDSSSGGKKKVVIKKVVDDFPWWIIVIIVVVVLIIGGLIAFLLIRRKKQQKNAASDS